MHELSITQNILEIATEQAELAGATKVTNVYLVIGQLSSIIDDSVQFYWDIISKNSIAENAKLHFCRVEAEIKCLECHHQYKLENELIPCPECGSINIKFITGDEFYMERIEIIN